MLCHPKTGNGLDGYMKQAVLDFRGYFAKEISKSVYQEL